MIASFILSSILLFSSPEPIEIPVEETVVETVDESVENVNDNLVVPYVAHDPEALATFVESLRNNARLEGGTYLTVLTSELGTIKVYIDDTYKDEWGFDGTAPIFVRTSSIYGYVLANNSTSYRITINPFSTTWQYRVTQGNQYYTYDLNVIGFNEDASTIRIQGSFPDINMLFICLLVLIIGLQVVQVIKK